MAFLFNFFSFSFRITGINFSFVMVINMIWQIKAKRVHILFKMDMNMYLVIIKIFKKVNKFKFLKSKVINKPEHLQRRLLHGNYFFDHNLLFQTNLDIYY